MTDSVNVSPGHVGEPLENARTFRHAAHSEGWVVPSTETLLADVRSELAAGPYSAFGESHSGTSYDVTIDTGEAIVGGVALARDTTTTVNLDSNTTNQVVYVGWAQASKDTVVIGLDTAFTDSNPKIPLWEFDTDGSGTTASRDQRDIDSTIGVKNKRYEGGGTKVDKAKTADEIAGVNISNLLRGDQNDRTSGVLGFEGQASISGSLGRGDGEVTRYAGGSSDAQLSLQGGHGRMVFAWNAYYDGSNSTWRSVVGGEPHAALALVNSDPGLGTGTANLAFATASSNSSSGDAISWNFTAMENDGDWDFNGGELKEAVMDSRSSRPSNPVPGQFIYRTDKDA